MKALIWSGVLLLLWISGYYIWDYSEFQKHPLPKTFITRLPLMSDKEDWWIDFFHSYSFKIKPTTQCSEACCVRLQLLPWQLEYFNTIDSTKKLN